MHWDAVRAKVDELWVPNDAPHHSIVGLTGSGKSYLVRHGILPLVRHDRVLFVDSKGDDPTMRGFGRKVTRIPPRWRRMFSEPEPESEWFKLSLSANFDTAKRQVSQALNQVYREGQWVVVFDETRHITDARIPGLGHRALYEQLMLRGRSRRVCVIGCTQSPRWVPSSFYDQPSFVWAGRLSDEMAQKRLREVGGISKAHQPILAGLPKRHWLLIADSEPLAITTVTK